MEPGAPPWLLTALDLRGRRVLVAGGGQVAGRRLAAYLDAGAVVDVVAPEAGVAVTEAAEQGRITWHRRAATPQDVAGAWFVLAATDSPEANRAIAERAERERVFCVRADDADGGTARTPATAVVDGFWIGVVGHRDPRGSASLRSRIVELLRGP